MHLREYEKEYKDTNPLLAKSVKYLAYIGILCLFVFYYLNRDDWKAAREEREAMEIAEEKAAYEAILLGERLLNYEQTMELGHTALEQEDYFQAVFHFRNAVKFNPESILTQERFIEALEQSCDMGTEVHCDQLEGQRERLESLLEAKGELRPLEQIKDSLDFLLMPKE